jgi:hypothetical protein
MAADWIRMRVALERHPKVIGMAMSLAKDRSFINWLTDPVRKTCAETALEHVALEVVTRVTVASLLTLWGVVNETGIRRGKNVIMRGAEPFMVDQMSGLPGLAQAMIGVGWLEHDRRAKALVFPRFAHHNVTFEERTEPLSNAERQHRFRERQRAVTKVTESNAKKRIEEKRREEEKKDPPNPPPSGGIEDELTEVTKAAMREVERQDHEKQQRLRLRRSL